MRPARGRGFPYDPDEAERLLRAGTTPAKPDTRSDEEIVAKLRRKALLHAEALADGARTDEQRKTAIDATKTAFAICGVSNEAAHDAPNVRVLVVESHDADGDARPDRQAEQAADEGVASAQA